MKLNEQKKTQNFRYRHQTNSYVLLNNSAQSDTFQNNPVHVLQQACQSTQPIIISLNFRTKISLSLFLKKHHKFQFQLKSFKYPQTRFPNSIHQHYSKLHTLHVSHQQPEVPIIQLHSTEPTVPTINLKNTELSERTHKTLFRENCLRAQPMRGVRDITSKRRCTAKGIFPADQMQIVACNRVHTFIIYSGASGSNLFASRVSRHRVAPVSSARSRRTKAEPQILRLSIYRAIPYVCWVHGEFSPSPQLCCVSVLDYEFLGATVRRRSPIFFRVDQATRRNVPATRFCLKREFYSRIHLMQGAHFCPTISTGRSSSV